MIIDVSARCFALLTFAPWITEKIRICVATYLWEVAGAVADQKTRLAAASIADDYEFF